jgi:hypothetical protein
MSYSMARPQQCCQSCNENIPVLPLLLKSASYFNNMQKGETMSAAIAE